MPTGQSAMRTKNGDPSPHSCEAARSWRPSIRIPSIGSTVADARQTGKTLIIGLGNPIVSDDSVGLARGGSTASRCWPIGRTWT